jgi:galactose-1-phosphate uridylyltransferase
VIAPTRSALTRRYRRWQRGARTHQQMLDRVVDLADHWGRMVQDQEDKQAQAALMGAYLAIPADTFDAFMREAEREANNPDELFSNAAQLRALRRVAVTFTVQQP